MNGNPRRFHDAIVIGAGVSGLTAAALLARRGLNVLVLERHNVVGGCASFYQKCGFRFDVGATLVGGFSKRGVHRRVFDLLGAVVDVTPVEPAMLVHVCGVTVARYGDERWKSERLRAFGAHAEPFWDTQERIADAAWDVASRALSLPVDLPSALRLFGGIRFRQANLLQAYGRTIASILPRDAGLALRTFVDAQLFITSQSDASATDLIYGATALDLAREGTFHLPGGIATISTALARAFRALGGRVAFGAQAVAIETERNGVTGGERVSGVRLADGEVVYAPRVISALPIYDTARLCPPLERELRPRIAALPQRWGAFTLYCGLPPNVVPADLPAHHQLVVDAERPLGEGNSVFASFSTPGDRSRARNGGCAVTLSTHTDVARWERAAASGTLEALRERYAGGLRDALDRIVPGASGRAELVESGTPLTFARYTARYRGLVGGLPQTPQLANLHALSQRTPLRGLYLCGDTTFPGQSTVGASLSGINAASAATSTSLRGWRETSLAP